MVIQGRSNPDSSRFVDAPVAGRIITPSTIRSPQPRRSVQRRHNLRPSRFSAHVRAHDWFAVAVDFLIVVLGVYVAVWVSNRQAARDRQEQTTKVVAALRQDLRDSSAVEQKFDQALDPALAAFKAARERGETPPPVFLRISGSDTPPRSPCLGVFQARIAD